MEVQNVTAEKYTDQQLYEMAIEYANRPENKDRLMSKFELAFGKNKFVRTRKQWCRLVKVYGIEQVCEYEQMTAEEVNFKCLSLSKRLNEIQRQTNKKTS